MTIETVGFIAIVAGMFCGWLLRRIVEDAQDRAKRARDRRREEVEDEINRFSHLKADLADLGRRLNDHHNRLTRLEVSK